MKKILLFQWFKPNDAAREAELRACIEHNIRLGFDEIVILNHQVEPAFHGANIKNVSSENRIGFRDFVDLITTAPSGSKICSTNTDIKLDPKILHLMDAITQGQIACISRHEKNGELCPVPHCSQDTWVCASQSLHKSVVSQASMPFGAPGCENRFAEVCFSAGMEVFNPSMDIKNVHIHAKENVHRDEDRMYGAYLFMVPCLIADVVAKRTIVQPVYLSRQDPTRSFKINYRQQ